MNSAERKENRYQRRHQKRIDKKIKFYNQFTLNRIINLNNLYDAYKKSKKGVSWKASVQRYKLNFIKKLIDTKTKILNNKDIRKDFIEFNIIERGKKRFIQSVHFYERVVQRSVCKNILIPLLSNELIYDNGASIKNKGTSFSNKRLKLQIQKYYRQNKFSNEGYALLIDYSSYFANIQHQPIKDTLYTIFKTNIKLYEFLILFVDSFGEKGLGLGSEICQILAIHYPNKIDHFIKEKLKIKYYGRYMDDSYLIHSDKKYLNKCLIELTKICDELGIKINAKKTKIFQLKKGFPFLKSSFILMKNGKLIIKPTKDSIVRERRKLKKLGKLDNINYEELIDIIVNSYMSWKGYISFKNSHKLVLNIEKLYIKILNNIINKGVEL